MSNIVRAYPGPILGIGNFNYSLDQSEKYGEKLFANSSHQDRLKTFMDKNGLVDMGFSSPIHLVKQ